MKFKSIYIIILIIFNINSSKKIVKRILIEKKFVNFIEKVEQNRDLPKKENKTDELKLDFDILEKIKSIKKLYNEIDNEYSELKEIIKKIDEHNKNINSSLININNSFINNANTNKHSKRRKLFILFIILLVITIYIIELKYEKNKKEKYQKKDKKDNYHLNKNENNTKLYVSL